MDARDRLMKVSEAATILSLSRSCLEKNPSWLPRVKVGRSVRYRLSDLERIVEGRLAA